MKLSIITICYNEANIRSTCESIINQSYKDFEWIVIDGGSEEATLDILNEYREHMAIFVSEKDHGVYNAMNKGIELAQGEYLNFMNGGDYYFDNDSLKRVAEFGLDKDIIYGDQRFLTGADYFEKKYPKTLPYKWFIKDCLPHQSSFIKRGLFDNYGKYNEKYKIVSDWEKWIIFIEINKVSYKHINTMVAIHRYDGISSVYDETHLNERKDIIKKYYGQCDSCKEIGRTIFEPKKYIKLFKKIHLLKFVSNETEICLYLFEHFPVLKIVRENL